MISVRCIRLLKLLLRCTEVHRRRMKILKTYIDRDMQILAMMKNMVFVIIGEAVGHQIAKQLGE